MLEWKFRQLFLLGKQLLLEESYFAFEKCGLVDNK